MVDMAGEQKADRPGAVEAPKAMWHSNTHGQIRAVSEGKLVGLKAFVQNT